MQYPKLFSEGQIGGLTLKNRLVMPAMGTAMASACGEITDHHIAYYEERAKGGVGLIIAEGSLVEYKLGKSDFSNPRVDSARFIPMWFRLANAIHKYDTKMFVQLHHAGRQSNTALTGGEQMVAPSSVPSGIVKETPRELTVEEIVDLEDCFATSASISQMAGMDGVEIHAAHGFLINQFLSLSSNKRTDAYGGPLENRVRFAKNIVQKIKAKCGRNFPVIIRLSVAEFVTGGITLQEGVKIARFMEEAGYDGINVSCGTYESFPTFIEPVTYEQGWRAYLARAVRKEIRIPVISVGVIREPGFAESILVNGKADFVGIGRGLIADPNWGEKSRRGKEEEIRKCISCLYCIDNASRGAHLACAINARAGRELEFSDLKYNGRLRKVVVVGGGPAGMEAARILAMREFNVVLFEKEEQLGGQIKFGNKPRGKEKMTWLIDYLSKTLNDLKVEVKLNTEASPDTIMAKNPYAVFLCFGGSSVVPDIEGVNGENVYVAESALLKHTSFENERIGIIGAGMTGCELAELLAFRGNEIYLVEKLPDIAADAGFINKMDIMERLKKPNIHIHTDHKLTGIKGNRMRLENLGEQGQVTIDVDKVVFCSGVKPLPFLYAQLHDELDNVILIGDAREPRRIADAIREGFIKGSMLE